jgi:hypothetical protein
MERWLAAAGNAARLVSAWPALWLPGALAWLATVGWISLVAGVAQVPSEGELTVFGAGFYTSGAWPWNAMAVGAAAMGAVMLAFGLAAIGESALLGLLRGDPLTRPHAIDVVAVSVVTAGPTLLAILASITAAAIVAPGEFTAPATGAGPVLRIVARLAPFLIAIAALAALGAAVHAAAVRLLGRAGREPLAALRDAPRALGSPGAAAAWQLAAHLAVRIVFLVVATVLVRVLWAPIGVRLGGGGFDVAVALLLVGFVAIWLVIVLGGGAVHAWGSATWSGLLDARAGEGRPDRHEETPIGR